MKYITFGAWSVSLNKREEVDDVFDGEAVLSSPPQGVDVPAIMLDGIQFTATTEGVRGANVKYIFPPLIPRILAALKG